MATRRHVRTPFPDPASADRADRPDIEICQDLPFQHRVWAAQRIGWIVMLAFVAAAAAGLFSAGPLSRTEARDPDGLITVEHERFARFMSSTTLRLTMASPANGQDRVTIWMSQALVEGLDIERMRPEPARALASPDGLHLEFAVAPTGGAAAITLNVRPQSIGPLEGEVGVVGREPARLAVFVYP